MTQKLSFNCTFKESKPEERLEKKLESVVFNPKFQSKISSLESEYDQIIEKKNEIEETIIHELYSEKKELVGDFDQLKFEIEFLKQDVHHYKKLVKTLDKQNIAFKKEVADNINGLNVLAQKLKDIDSEIETISRRIARVQRILALDESKLNNLDKFTDTAATLIENVSSRKIKLQELEMNKKKSVERKFAFEDYLANEKEAVGQLIDVLQEFDANNQLKKREIEEEIKQAEMRIEQAIDERETLSSQKEYIESRLFDLNGNSRGIMSNILKNEAYVLITEELPKKLNQAEADSIRAWNTLLQLNNNVKIGTLDFDSEIMPTVIRYKQLGWLPQNVRIYNLFNDLLGVKKSRSVSKEQMNHRKESLLPFFAKEEDGVKYYYDLKENTTLTVREQTEDNLEYYHFVNDRKEYVEVYDAGSIVMDREIVEGGDEVQRYYDINGEVALTIKLVAKELEYIRYQDIQFRTHQELLIYWLTHFIEKDGVINLIIDQKSQLFIDRDLFKQNGINLVPLIQEVDKKEDMHRFIVENHFEEIFVLNRNVFNSIESLLNEDCLIRVLEGNKEIYPAKPQIIVDSQ
ncbi:hypothetical protein [Vagococcus carniphilus]|uniref:Uncharacterized protein n=1 Tax=Vagococcus carniphilus TaxID=218144 RepID=A0A430B8Y7_9ENTE|nr:hypothetical protein [Vagococcus carniphilus]QNN73663.1 hypothetical protein H9L18_03450 [Vagococcus carniphilus]RSU16814.1 hypothetical protein CBF28_01100 [Vagococcus carniphilus]